MDAGASVITLVGLALSSAHCIFNTLCSIKNAPQTIQQMFARVLTLSKLLEQLKTHSESLHSVADLPHLISKCAEDLRKIKEDVEKASSKRSSRAGNLGRNVMVMLQGREWDESSKIVLQHYAALSLQLSIIEGYAYALIILTELHD